MIIVTTFHNDGYLKYGRKCIESFLKHWPDNIKMAVYVEDDISLTDSRLDVRNLHDCCQGLVEFKSRHGNNLHHSKWRHDSVRFANKVFAIAHAATTTDDDMVVWMDADTITFKDVDSGFLDKLLPPTYYLSCLMRKSHYTETGFVAYRTSHPRNSEFMSRLRGLYETDELFKLPEWHDCAAFDHVRIAMESEGILHCYNLNTTFNEKHPFINSILGEYFDHLKGQRKTRGKSSTSDLSKPRTEDYWLQ